MNPDYCQTEARVDTQPSSKRHLENIRKISSGSNELLEEDDELDQGHEDLLKNDSGASNKLDRSQSSPVVGKKQESFFPPVKNSQAPKYPPLVRSPRHGLLSNPESPEQAMQKRGEKLQSLNLLPMEKRSPRRRESAGLSVQRLITLYYISTTKLTGSIRKCLHHSTLSVFVVKASEYD